MVVRPRRASLQLASALLPLLGAFSQAGSATPLQINGSGSSWAANAINQWVQDVYNSKECRSPSTLTATRKAARTSRTTSRTSR